MATESPKRPQIVRFGTFEADLARRELHKSGVRIKLHGQPFEVLAVLLERPGGQYPAKSSIKDCGQPTLSLILTPALTQPSTDCERP